MRLSVSFAFCALASLGCKSRGDSSHILHAAGQWTNGAEKWQWDTTSDEEYRQVLLPYNDYKPEHAVRLDDPLTVRASAIIASIDAALRAKNPAMVANVPPPVAEVIKDADGNAFVSSAPVCADLNIALPGTADDDQPIERIHITQSGAVESVGSDQCLKRDANPDQMAKMVSWFNAHHVKGGCQLSFDATSTPPTLTVGEHCEVPGALSGHTAKAILYEATSNRVTVNTGLFSAYPREAEFLFIIAHELGHYYRAHANATADDYDFFYLENEDHNPDARPARGDDALQREGATMITASAAYWSSLSYVTPKGATFAAQLYEPIAALIDSRKENECMAARAHLKALRKLPLGDFPKAEITGKTLKAYLAFDKDLPGCLKSIKVVDTGVSAGHQIRWRLLEDSLSAITGLGYKPGAPDGWNAAEVPTVFAALSRANAALGAIIKTAVPTLQAGQAKKIGYYTYEQEADELAIEFGYLAGVNPQVAVDANLTLGGDTTDADKPTGEVSPSACRKLAENNWRDGSGKAVWPPISDFSDEHHSTCFRAFNAARELAAHQTEFSDPPAASLPKKIDLGDGTPATSWEKLRKISANYDKQASGAAAAGSTASSAAPLAANTHRNLQRLWGHCPYQRHPPQLAAADADDTAAEDPEN